MKTALATATTSGKTLDDVLLSLRLSPISPNLPSPREILHNCTEECPGHPSHPVDCEQVRNYLLDKKTTQKEYHDKKPQCKTIIRTGTRTENSLPQPKRRKSIHRRHHHYQGSYTKKVLHRVPRQDLLPYTPTHMHHQHRKPVSQDHQQETVPVSQDHQQSRHYRDKHVSQDHHHSHRVTISQDHQQRYRDKQPKKLITGPPTTTKFN